VRVQLTHRIFANTKSEYATCEDFCRLFARKDKSLYLLSFLLTANSEIAEQCFVAGFEDCVNGISVFQDWVDCWARRAIVRRAVGLIEPRPGNAVPRMYPFHPADECTFPGIALQGNRFARVVALQDFERFAFVLCVLEGHSDQSCAVLLEVSRQEVRDARVRALDYLAGIFHPSWPLCPDLSQVNEQGSGQSASTTSRSIPEGVYDDSSGI
jgi:hypothetical protein